MTSCIQQGSKIGLKFIIHCLHFVQTFSYTYFQISHYFCEAYSVVQIVKKDISQAAKFDLLSITLSCYCTT